MKYLITGAVCLIIGILLGGGGLFLYNKKQTKRLETGIAVETIDGEPGIIEHEKFKDYPDRIEITTKAKKKGTIKTTIKKAVFCPPIYKNALSFVLYGGMHELQPEISYGVEYRRQVFSRFYLLCGLKVDTSIYMVNGFQGFVGAGVNF